MAVVKIVPVKTTPGNTLKYISNPNKTNSGNLVEGINCFKDYKKADMKMEYTRRKYGKDNRNKLLHVIHSYSNKEEKLTPELAHKVSLEWYKEMFSDRAITLAATHIKTKDEKSLHTHFCVNSIDIDGNRIKLDKAWIRKAKEKSNEICKKYGLENSILEFKNIVPNKSWYEWDCTNKGTSYKELIRKDIDALIDKVDSVEELFNELRKQGYLLKQGKYVSYKHPKQIRFVRDKTLGYYYTIEQLKKRIERSKDIEFIKFRDKKSNWIDSDIYKYRYAKGTIGNIFEIAIKIIKTKYDLGNEVDNRRYYRSNFKAVKSLEKLENALNLVDKYKVEKPEQVIRVINECENDIEKLYAWKTKAEKKLMELRKLENMLEEVGKVDAAIKKADDNISDRKYKINDMKAILEELDRLKKERDKEKNKDKDKDRDR